MRLAVAKAAMNEEQPHFGLAMFGEALRRLESELVGGTNHEACEALSWIGLPVPKALEGRARGLACAAARRGRAAGRDRRAALHNRERRGFDHRARACVGRCD